MLKGPDYIIEIAEQVSKELGGGIDLSTTRWISQPPDAESVKDATLALYVDGTRAAQDIVLLISNPSFPKAVAEDVARAHDIRARVSPQVSQHIITPVCEGTFGAQTWVAHSRLSPMSSSRGVRQLQKPGAVRRVLPWISALALDTKEHKTTPAAYDAYFVQPLEHLANDPDLSSGLRRLAQDCRATVLAQRPDLFTVVQHGDFWIGNVLFQRRWLPDFNPGLGDFRIIDWRGARLDGYPCGDVIRFISSLYRGNSPKTASLLAQYRTCLEISEFDMAVYSLAGLGQLGQALDQFPKESYCLLCEETFAFLQRHTAQAVGG